MLLLDLFYSYLIIFSDILKKNPNTELEFTIELLISCNQE